MVSIYFVKTFMPPQVVDPWGYLRWLVPPVLTSDRPPTRKKKRTRKKRTRGEIWFLSEVRVACRVDLFVEGEIQEWSQDRQEEGKVSEQLSGQTFLWITTKIWWHLWCLCPGRYIHATFCIWLWWVQGVFGSQIKTTWSEETWRLGYG